MVLNKEIFRKYDIRGIYGKDFNKNSAKLIGKAFGTYLLNNSKHKNIKVLIAKDGRISSDEIEEEFKNGLKSTGVEITNIGLSASPIFLYSLCKGKFDGGAIITASHNPKEYNGFKLELKNSKSLSGEELQKIYEIIEKGDFVKGKEIEVKNESFFVNYLRKIRDIETKGIGDFNFKKNQTPKIIVDGGNGVGGIFAVNILRFLGYEVEELFCEVDGNFPNHQADPVKEENLKDLKNKVAETKADLGIALDGDGDRVGIVDKNGKSYSAEEIMMPLIESFLEKNPGAGIVCDLKTSGIIKDFVESKGGKYYETAVGHPYLKEKMSKDKILFGAESSGHFYLADKYFIIDDAFLASALFLKFFFKRDKKINIQKYFDKIKNYFKYSEEFLIDENKKFEKIEEIKKILKPYCKEEGSEKNSKGELGEISFLDGIKIQYDNFTKVIIRASNTSPKIQFEIESKDKEKIENLKNKILKEIKIF